jgi:hypothetical protein
MAVLTVADIIALDFGYLVGADLLRFCPSQFLINQETITPGFIEGHVQTAYAEIISDLSSKCEIAKELTKTPGSVGPPVVPDTRSKTIVKYVATMAIKNIVSRAPGLPDHLKSNFAEVNQAIMDIRNGQKALPDLAFETTADQPNISRTTLVKSSFKTIG